MLTYMGVSAIAGILLGFRFRISVLIPATILVMASAAFVSAANSHPAGIVVLSMTGTVALFQLGYLAGRFVEAILPMRTSTFLLWQRSLR